MKSKKRDWKRLSNPGYTTDSTHTLFFPPNEHNRGAAVQSHRPLYTCSRCKAHSEEEVQRMGSRPKAAPHCKHAMTEQIGRYLQWGADASVRQAPVPSQQQSLRKQRQIAATTTKVLGAFMGGRQSKSQGNMEEMCPELGGRQIDLL